MASKNKFPVPFLLFLGLIIFICAIFFAIFSVEYFSKNENISTTDIVEITTDLTTNKTIESTAKNTTIYKTTTKAPTATTKQTTKSTNETTTTKPVTTNSTASQQTTKPKSKYYNENDIISVAKVLYSECRGVKSDTQKACVVWAICNRVDSYGTSIQSVINSKGQFRYNRNSPIQTNLYNIAKDVLERWSKEKSGEKNVGRVLPKNYLYFHGDGKVNYFKTSHKKPYTVWNYSLPSPYST